MEVIRWKLVALMCCWVTMPKTVTRKGKLLHCLLISRKKTNLVFKASFQIALKLFSQKLASFVNVLCESKNKIFYCKLQWSGYYRKHQSISRTFSFKTFVSNRGCSLHVSVRTSVHHAINLHILTLFSENFSLYRPV